METNRIQFLQKHKQPLNKSLSISGISTLSKVPIKILNEVYKRGYGAWSSNIKSVRLKEDYSKNIDTKAFPRASRLTPEQWAYARIYSFVNKGKTFYTADSDLAKKI